MKNNRWLFVTIALCLCLSGTAMAKQIPWPDDPPDLSKYSGSPSQIWGQANHDFSSPFFNISSGPWLDTYSEAIIQTPTNIMAYARYRVSEDGGDIQEAYSLMYRLWWQNSITIWVILESDTLADFTNLKDVQFTLEIDSGQQWPCRLSDSVRTSPSYISKYDYWSWLEPIRAPISGPALFAENPRWIRLNMQMGDKRGYFQWDLQPATPSRTSTSLIDTLDFRNTRWGMTKSEVRAAEKETLLVTTSNPNMLFGIVTVSGHEEGLIYEFDSNGLLQGGGYLFRTIHANDRSYITDYQKMRDLLISNYGQPKIDGPVWKRDLLRGNPDLWGIAVRYGDLSFISMWYTPTTVITLMLSGEDGEIAHTLLYTKQSLAPSSSAK